MNNQGKQWEASYSRKDNFLFYPHEEVIRFVSKYIRKRVGFNEFRDVMDVNKPPKVLDLGCGIGRHIIFGYEMGLDVYGIDLSGTAVDYARQWAEKKGICSPSQKIVQGDIRKLPWPNNYFDGVMSHGVLDSMNFEIACEAIKEVQRVLSPKSIFYCDLVSGDDSSHAREYSGEEFVTTLHEKDTIQSYFNFEKINRLIDNLFEMEECTLIKKENVLTGGIISRYHLVLRRREGS